jgi:hypothetical protein
MCPFVIVVIMIALILFMPAVYAMGVTRGITVERTHECAEGGKDSKDGKNVSPEASPIVPASSSVPASPSTAPASGAQQRKTLPSSQPQTKCTKCAKMKFCMDPPPELSVFCL